MARYNTVVFDFDGTIADTFGETRLIYNHLAADYGLRIIEEHEMPALRHFSLKQFLAEYDIPKRRVPALLARGTGLMRGGIERLKLIDGMGDALTGLRTRVRRFGILTSNSHANVDVFLRNHGLRETFDFISSTTKLTGKAKHLRSIRRTFSIPSEEMLFVGDEIRDVKAAKKAGVPVAAVTWGFNSREALAAENPEFLIDQPFEFARLA
ncbi:MAG: HAD-IA family hydrolase [Verrucomicrobiota bacterium]